MAGRAEHVYMHWPIWGFQIDDFSTSRKLEFQQTHHHSMPYMSQALFLDQLLCWHYSLVLGSPYCAQNYASIMYPSLVRGEGATTRTYIIAVIAHRIWIEEWIYIHVYLCVLWGGVPSFNRNLSRHQLSCHLVLRLLSYMSSRRRKKHGQNGIIFTYGALLLRYILFSFHILSAITLK